MRAHRPIEATRGKEERGPTSEHLGLKGAVLVASDRNAHVRNNLGSMTSDAKAAGAWKPKPENDLFDK